MAELIAGLMAWIAAHAAYDAALAGAPAIRVADDLCAEMRLPPRCRVGAYYDHRAATVVLRREWSPDSVEDRSLLLHELVHHLQAASGTFDFDTPMGRCRGEAEAFALMARWLQANGARARPDIRRAVRDACAAHFARGLDRR